MGLLSGLTGGSKSTSVSTSSSSSSSTPYFNPRMMAAQNSLLDRMKLVGTQRFEGYRGARVANPSIADTTARIRSLMNPYSESVIDGTMGDMRRERDIALRDQQLAAGGSSSDIRKLFMENEIGRTYADRMGSVSGQLRADAWDKAAGEADKMTQRDQAQLDANFEEFARKQGWNAQQLASWASAFNAAQLAPVQTSESEQTSTTKSKSSGGIGGVLSGIGALSGFM